MPVKSTKRPVAVAGVVLLLILAVAFVRGWTWARYDRHDPSIGKQFVIVRPMVYLTNVNRFYAGREIANEFGSLITPKRYWQAFESQFSMIKAENVPCGERITVISALYLIPIGLIEGATKPRIKYYVVQANGISKTVMEESDFENYTEPLGHSGDSSGCVSPGMRKSN